ncbi:MAG: hypothetical protein U0Y68_02445 [Blastocatellia bacterium]
MSEKERRKKDIEPTDNHNQTRREAESHPAEKTPRSHQTGAKREQQEVATTQTSAEERASENRANQGKGAQS